jgi:hypothetical protein
MRIGQLLPERHKERSNDNEPPISERDASNGGARGFNIAAELAVSRFSIEDARFPMAFPIARCGLLIITTESAYERFALMGEA